MGDSRQVGIRPGRRPAKWLLAAALLPAPMSCGGGATVLPDAGTRLRFVETTDHAYEIGAVVAHIGALDERVSFGSVRDILVTGSGYYVADGLHPRIVLLDRQLNVKGIIGREGQGPGEWSSPSRLAGDEGRIIVMDGGAGRLQHLTPSGDFISVAPLPGNARSLDYHSERGLVVASDAYPDYYLVRMSGGESIPFARIPGALRVATGEHYQLPMHETAVSGDGTIHVLDNEHLALVSYGDDGQLLGVRFFPEPARSLRLDHRARTIESFGGRSRVLGVGLARVEPLPDGRLFVSSRLGGQDPVGYVLDVGDLTAIPVFLSPDYGDGGFPRPSDVHFDGIERVVMSNSDAEVMVADVRLVALGRGATR